MPIGLTDIIVPKADAFADIVNAKNVGGSGTSSNALQADTVANNAANRVLRVDSGNSYIEAAALTAGAGITITNGAGGIEVAVTGGGGGGSLTFSDGTTSDTITLSTDTLKILGGTNISSSVSTAANSVTISLPSTIYGGFTIGNGDFAVTTGVTYAYGGIVAGVNGLVLQSGGKITLSPIFGTCDISISVPTPNSNADWEMKLPPSIGTANQVLGISSVASGVASLGWISAGTGDVVGPASSTLNGIATFSSTTGKAIASNSVTLSSGTLNMGTGSISNAANVTATNGYFGTSGSGVLIGYNGVTASSGSAFMLTGATSGVVSIVPGAAAAGTYTWKLPTSFPTSTNQFLKTTGATGETGWASIPAAEYLYRLTADEANYTTAGLTLVTSFAHSMAASTKYRVDGVLIVNQASATPNFRMAFDAPGTASTLNVFATNFNEGAGAQRLTIVNTDNTGFVIQQPGGLNYIIVSGFIVTGSLSGSVNFYGGQGTASSGNPTTLKAGSFLTYTEVL